MNILPIRCGFCHQVNTVVGALPKPHLYLVVVAAAEAVAGAVAVVVAVLEVRNLLPRHLGLQGKATVEEGDIVSVLLLFTTLMTAQETQTARKARMTAKAEILRMLHLNDIGADLHVVILPNFRHCQWVTNSIKGRHLLESDRALSCSPRQKSTAKRLA